MLLAPIGLSTLYRVVALIVALTVHEAAHALVANRLGDSTAKDSGRISLNPFAHLDLYGTLALIFVGLGWGKPVMMNPEKLKPNLKVGMALVAAAGPLSNFILAAIFAVVVQLRIFPLYPDIRIPLPFMPSGYQVIYLGLGPMLQWLVWVNLQLAVFNLLPINPLDGSRLWQVVLPMSWYMQIMRFEILGLGVILAIFLSDLFAGTGFLSPLLTPLMALWRLFTGLSSPAL